jgi:threonine synthase
MKYTSTRSADVVATFEEVICSGYAPDGGLFVPTEIPTVSKEDLHFFATLGYVDLAYQIFRRFIGVEEIPDEKLRDISEAAFFGFEDPAHAVPIVKIGPIFVSELFHGPTFCFKDLG